MRDLNPRDFRLRVFETRALGRYANPPWASYFFIKLNLLRFEQKVRPESLFFLQRYQGSELQWKNFG
jgi:hypothetical protein